MGVKRAWQLSILVLIALPVVLYARISGTKVILMPEIVDSFNSQTMSLLEGFLNTNPTGIGGAEIAIVDSTALESTGGTSEAFVELGKSGSGEISLYVVREGDTLSEIGDMFGVNVNTIVWANDLRGKTIKVGQELVILPISGVRHTIKSGDTIKTIATKYKADVEDILSYNNLTATSKLKAGDVIIIPDGVVVPTATNIAKPSGGTSYPSIVGFFMRPISGGKKTQGIHGNNGVDIGAPVGTPVMASASGKVIVSRKGGYNGGFGTYIVISHSNGTQTLYAHLSANNVSIGQEVTQGEVIGSIGMTGRTTGPHIHFEVRGAKNPF